MLLRAAALTCLMFLAGSTAAIADERGASGAAASKPAATSEPAAEAAALPAWVVREPQKRPATLSALYGTYGSLAVADFVSTKKAIAAGAREGNPVMGSGNSTRMVIVKSAGAAMSIYFAERMWKKNKVGAIVTMALVNSISAAVVAHNMQLAKR